MKYLQKTAPNEKFVNLADRMRKKLKKQLLRLSNARKYTPLKFTPEFFFQNTITTCCCSVHCLLFGLLIIKFYNIYNMYAEGIYLVFVLRTYSNRNHDYTRKMPNNIIFGYFSSFSPYAYNVHCTLHFFSLYSIFFS